MRSWLDTFLGVRNRGRNWPWTRRGGGRAGVQSQWNIFLLVWSGAFGRIERALPAQFRFCVRGAADTRVTVSQNREMRQNESRFAANPALRGAHLGETKLHRQAQRRRLRTRTSFCKRTFRTGELCRRCRQDVGRTPRSAGHAEAQLDNWQRAPVYTTQLFPQ